MSDKEEFICGCGCGWTEEQIDTHRAEEDEERCRACGCSMAEVDRSTESGFDYTLECNNSKCKSKRSRDEDNA